MTVSALLITSATCRPESVRVESRPGEDSAIFVRHVTGVSRYADRAAVTDMIRPTAIQRLASVWTVNTTPLGRTVKCVPLVTMVMRLVVSVPDGSYQPRFHGRLVVRTRLNKSCGQIEWPVLVKCFVRA